MQIGEKVKEEKKVVVDDHAINSLRVYFDVAYDELKKEWKSGQFGKLLIVHLLKLPLHIVRL
jgi:hypothetical protein